MFFSTESGTVSVSIQSDTAEGAEEAFTWSVNGLDFCRGGGAGAEVALLGRGHGGLYDSLGSRSRASPGAGTAPCSQPASAFHHGVPGRGGPQPPLPSGPTPPRSTVPLSANRKHLFSLKGCVKLLLRAPRLWLLSHFGPSY